MAQIGKNKKFINKYDSKGNAYPTTNKDFVPPEKPDSTVTFKGGTIGNKKVVVNGNTMSLEDYNNALKNKGNVNASTRAYSSQQGEMVKRLEDAKRIEQGKNNALIKFAENQAIGEMTTAANKEKNKDVLSKLGEPIPALPVENKPFSDKAAEFGMNIGGIVKSTAQQASMGAAGGAALGAIPAVATAGLSIPVGAAIGGIVGAATGLLTGIQGLSVERRQDTKEAYNDFTNSKARLTNIITALNNKQISPETAYEYYQNEWQQINQVEVRLQKLTSTAIGRQLSKAMDEKADVEAMISYKDMYDRQFELAVVNPTNKYVPPETNTQVVE